MNEMDVLPVCVAMSPISYIYFLFRLEYIQSISFYQCNSILSTLLAPIVSEDDTADVLHRVGTTADGSCGTAALLIAHLGSQYYMPM